MAPPITRPIRIASAVSASPHPDDDVARDRGAAKLIGPAANSRDAGEADANGAGMP